MNSTNDIDANKKYTASEKKMLVYKIGQLKEFNEKQYYMTLWDIFKKNNVNYTRNNNGVFIDMNKVNDKTLLEIENFFNMVDTIQKKKSAETDSISSIDNSDKPIVDSNYETSLYESKLNNHEKNILRRNKITTDSLSEDTSVIYRTYGKN
ncbi:MAG: hypothetical protein Faunusvirus36_2 [Faunusvirus sp.]|jgi:hypothetical protein|uniref:NET domain-containing protein n=1 Tax=Faunusvirus sp. TaxID=2487766 RepID=A0A3G4ZXN8_9VIRU|nr:MAG: hypothetical protein Faunusvirus36_2 [Faunusvirus sp.]